MSVTACCVKSKGLAYVCAAVALAGAGVFLMQMWSIHCLWTPVGFVDTWPLFDRLMKYKTGQLSIDHYLFDPHVHPHSIVYFLYLMDKKLGTGRQLVPHFATMLSVVGLIATVWFMALRVRTQRFTPDLRVYIFLFGSLVVLSGFCEATIIPFQCVVVVTRFAYALLLALFVYCQYRPNPVLHSAVLAMSCVAVSFFASGGIFAAEIILLHALFFRKQGWLIASALPLVAYLMLVTYYPPPKAESIAIIKVLRHMNFVGLAQLIFGSMCYYISALFDGWPAEIELKWGFTEISAMIVAGIVWASTVAWSFYTLAQLFRKNWHRQAADETVDSASLYMALLGLWVFASSLSATLLWMARVNYMGAPPGSMSVHFQVLTQNRYAAFSSLGYMVFLYMGMVFKRRNPGMAMSLAAFALILIVGVNAMGPRRMGAELAHRHQIEFSATALLMGMSPADPEGNFVYPGVELDWYWPSELPRTVAYLHANNMSYNYQMPTLGEITGRPKVPLGDYEIKPVAEKPTVCRIKATATSPETPKLFAPQRFFPVTAQDGKTIGYVVQENGTAEGHILCQEAANRPPLFLAARK